MADKLLIDGGLVQRIREEVVAQTTLEEFLSHNQTSVTTPILPEGTVFYRVRGNNVTVVTQQRPRMHEIKGNRRALGVRGEGPDMVGLNLPLPWTVVVHHLQKHVEGTQETYSYAGMRVLFRPRMLADNDKVLKAAPLLNTYADSGNICTGSQMSGHRTTTIPELVGIAEHMFWNTPFNTDLSPNERAMRLLGGNFQAWSRLTVDRVVELVNASDWPTVTPGDF